MEILAIAIFVFAVGILIGNLYLDDWSIPPICGGPQGITNIKHYSWFIQIIPIYKQNTSFILYIQTLIWAYLDSLIAQFGYLEGMG